jgi:hypothetical protein
MECRKVGRYQAFRGLKRPQSSAQIHPLWRARTPKKKAQQRWAFFAFGSYDFLRRRVMKPIAPSPASMSA